MPKKEKKDKKNGEIEEHLDEKVMAVRSCPIIYDIPQISLKSYFKYILYEINYPLVNYFLEN